MPPQPEGKTTEQLIASLEGFISPSARVEHNVWLTVVGKKRKRQCDAVIWFGSVPREQFVIVEVQKRRRKIGIADLDAWVEKMRELGANGLICVSQRGFTESVMDKVATTTGPTVKLLTLDNLKSDSGWADFTLGSGFRFNFLQWKILKVHSPILFGKIPRFRLECNYETPVVSGSADSPPVGSILTMCEKVVRDHSPGRYPLDYVGEGEGRMNFTLDGVEAEVWLHLKGRTFQIKEWVFELATYEKSEMLNLEYAKWQYSQADVEGALAWAATAEFDKGDKHYRIVLMFKRSEAGYLAAGDATVIEL